MERGTGGDTVLWFADTRSDSALEGESLILSGNELKIFHTRRTGNRAALGPVPAVFFSSERAITLKRFAGFIFTGRNRPRSNR
jgi:hypothetical protein